jgi:spermidine/putrescine transport system substrate-binding protein
MRSASQPSVYPRVARLLMLLMLLVTGGAQAGSGSITVLNWEEFLSERVVKALKNQHGITVNLLTFSTPEERERILREKRAQIDIVVADTVWSTEYRRRGWAEKLDAKQLPNIKHVMTRWRSDSEYAVPYLWGHTGIAWRTDKVKGRINSYAELFALAKQQPGKVSLIDDAQEALRAALYAFSKPPYAMETVAEIQAAKKMLQPHLRTLRIVGSELEEDSPWLDGSLIAGQAFNGDIAYLRDTYNAPLGFAIPSPGCMVFQEQMILLASAPNKQAAYRFLNLVNDPRTAARNAMDVRYATANTLAAQHLEAAFRNDPIIRPTFDGLDDCYFYDVLDKDAQRALEGVKLD